MVRDVRAFFSYFVLCTLFAVGCKKESASRQRAGTDIEMQVGDDRFSGAEENHHDMYSFGGMLGLYYGCSSVFRISGNESIEITLGTSLTNHSEVQEDDFVQLLQPGERSFGSLGSFTTYPQMKPGKVEIAFTDKDSKRWCSTRIVEKEVDGRIDANIFLEQPEGKFFIDDVKELTAEDGHGYRIRGHFDCFLYEVNGQAKKKIKGNFQGVVSAFE
jgi:hypothetical protein